MDWALCVWKGSLSSPTIAHLETLNNRFERRVMTRRGYRMRTFSHANETFRGLGYLPNLKGTTERVRRVNMQTQKRNRLVRRQVRRILFSGASYPLMAQ